MPLFSTFKRVRGLRKAVALNFLTQGLLLESNRKETENDGER
jgi:hypothetical protein